MSYFIGLDISDATTNICILDKEGIIIHEAVGSTHPQSIINIIKSYNMPIEKIGMETGTKSNWLQRALNKKYPTTCYDSLKIAKLISLKINKTDKNDARIIAEVARMECFSNMINFNVHVKTEHSQEILSLIRGRHDLMQQTIHIYNSVRGTLKTHGYSIPKTSRENFTKVVRAIKNLPEMIAFTIDMLISGYDTIIQSIKKLDQKIEELSKQNSNAQLLNTIPEVGPITSLYFALIIDDPARFQQAKAAGAYCGLTPSQNSSGQRQQQGKVSKKGDVLIRTLLVSVARRLLQNKSSPNALKKWGQKKEKTSGKNRAVIALARHLAVLMLAMLMDQTAYKEKPTRSANRVGLTLEREDIESLLEPLDMRYCM